MAPHLRINMAIAALFNKDTATLKGKLRLSGVTDGDAQAMFESAVITARILFYDELGVDRVTAIKLISLDDNPSTADGILRQKAAIAETKKARMELLRTLPTMVVDATPADQLAWNKEGFLRDTDPREVEKEIARLSEDLGTLLFDLKGNTPEPSKINVTTFGPDRDPMPRPGESIIPGAPRLYDTLSTQGI